MKRTLLKTRISFPLVAAFVVLSFALNAVPALAVVQNTTITVSVTKQASAALTLSGNAFTWANVQADTDHFLASDGGNIIVTGTLITSFGSGAGSIAIVSPVNITGAGGGTFPIGDLAITCAGTVQTGQTFATAQTALGPSATATCVTYASNYNTALNFTLGMFLDDRTLPADVYPATNFTVAATAT